MRRIGLFVVPLCAAVAACGGSDSAARTEQTRTSQPQRPAIVISAPKAGRIIRAGTYGGKRLRAVLRAAGSAAPGQQLTVHASCGYYDCDGITFANADGRWHTRVEAITPPKKSTVQLSIYYTDAHTGDIGATMGLRLHKGEIPQANPQPTPPKPSKGGSTGGEPSGTTTGGAAAPTPSRPYSGPRTMIVIGDSLAVGMASPLASLLSTWDVPTDARTGRPLAEGMEILRETQLPPGADGSRAILAFSLGTNDGPQSTDILERDVRYSVSRLGPHGCAVWATIARPPLNGVSYRAMNQRLYDLVNDPQLAGRLLVVPWAEQYARHKSWQASDGVHATGEGYAARAQMYAQAARSCAA